LPSTTDLLAHFGSATEAPIREMVAFALRNKGVHLSKLGRGEEAIDAYNDLLTRFGTATEAPIREEVAFALVNKGVHLGKLGRREQAIARLRRSARPLRHCHRSGDPRNGHSSSG
jgi:tetratricopeptide (TPR) repeat protein